MMPSGIARGSVVIVDFAPTNPASGVRPALVVQNDRDNARMSNTIVAQITSNVSRSHEPTQCLIDVAHPDWTVSGLRRPSVVNCSSVATVQQQHVNRVVGQLSGATMRQIDECLKAAFAIT
jgi:mRNA-degrading endonuclease toxin of MazEF toxin-antitoxin module